MEIVIIKKKSKYITIWFRDRDNGTENKRTFV